MTELNGKPKINWRAIGVIFGVITVVITMFSGWIAREFDKVYDEINKVETVGVETKEKADKAEEAIIWIRDRLENIEKGDPMYEKLQTYMRASMTLKKNSTLQNNSF